MTAPVVMHGEWEDNCDDPSHPIPALDALDIQAIKQGGGSDLAIVIASALQADEYSQRRLLTKLENYLGYLSTSKFQADCGIPTPENTAVIVQIHPGSDAAIFELLERCKPWVEANHASLQVKLLELM